MANPLKRLAFALLAAAFLAGVLTDPKPARPEVHRGKYRVLEGDFHAHTTFSDGSLTPLSLVRQADRRGLDVLGVTEHNTALPAKAARWWSKLTGGPVIVVGEEITTSRFHIIALGLDHTVDTHYLAKDVIADVHAQNGLAIAAHPVEHFWPALLPVRGDLDGSEVMHPIAYSANRGWRWNDMVTYWQDSDHHLMAIGSSDYHWGSILGLCRTLVFVEGEANESTVLAALHAHKTVVIDRDGKTYGDPELTALLDKEPYSETRAPDYRYHGENAPDRIFRTLGWIGLVTFVGFSARRRKKG